MRFVVTGGRGFIGGHLVSHLAHLGNKVTVIDNRPGGAAEDSDGVRFFNLDILDMDGLREHVRDSDGIFHQAALKSVPESFRMPEEYHRVNVCGTENVFRAAMEFGVKVVYASSSSVYGATDRLPVPEDSERNPANPYGVTKLDGELLAERLAGSGLRSVGLRYFNVYGRGQSPEYAGVITKFLNRIRDNHPPVIWGDGAQIRDFVFVDDVVRANLLAMTSPVDGGFFNIGAGEPTTIGALAMLMIRLSGRTLEPAFAELPEGDIRSSLADVSLAERCLSWKPETSLEDGISTLLDDGS